MMHTVLYWVLGIVVFKKVNSSIGWDFGGILVGISHKTIKIRTCVSVAGARFCCLSSWFKLCICFLCLLGTVGVLAAVKCHGPHNICWGPTGMPIEAVLRNIFLKAGRLSTLWNRKVFLCD